MEITVKGSDMRFSARFQTGINQGIFKF